MMHSCNKYLHYYTYFFHFFPLLKRQQQGIFKDDYFASLYLSVLKLGLESHLSKDTRGPQQ